jgi:hypothetical protein
MTDDLGVKVRRAMRISLAEIWSAITARTPNDPASFASTLSIGIRLLLFLGDDAAVDEWARQLSAVATEQGFPYWRGEGTAFLGWATVKRGDVAEGVSLLRSGTAAHYTTGACP